ncbi:potassium channel family protein [Thiohalorhabdus sp.]|uniref:potassium channel family protein n=1 Tax=Thiohalorhabdus sp. TaxID=3094134 RepID=UPI002FC3CAA3
MPEVIFLLLRRMRAPLVTLISAYAVAMLGLVLIPGETADGEPWRMDFFHAFYVVTYTAPTIGFGEIPHPFTGAQRLWMMFAIYGLVFAWLYAIGMLLSILQDPAFRRVVDLSRFRRSVRRLSEPFYIVCGYGENGSLVVRALADEGIRPVVVDSDAERIEALKVEGLTMEVPGLNADADDPQVLIDAGLNHPDCAGVIAVSRTDEANLSIAVASKLLAPQVPLICRARHRDTEANMASFGTEHIINPFDTFAERFAMAVRSPGMYLIYAWLTGIEHQPVARPLVPPRGKWILCGYGRFGKAMRERLAEEGVDTVVVEAEPEGTGAPEGTVVGRGTEAETLQEAGIEDAVGILAGTDSDPNNLSIILTARELNPNLFTVARQSLGRNQAIFEAADLDLVLDAGTVLTREVLGLITTPLMERFLQLTLSQDDAWANVLVSRITALVGDELPHTWSLPLGVKSAPAIIDYLQAGHPFQLGDLLTDPRDRNEWVPALPLLVHREGAYHLLPAMDMALQPADRILFCGRSGAAHHMAWTACDHGALSYVTTGDDRPEGWLWEWLARRGRGAQA